MTDERQQGPIVANGGGLYQRIVAVAGIGGAALVVLLFIYREIIRAKFFPTLDPTYSAILIGLIIVFTFFIAILAIYVWLVGNPNQAIRDRALYYVLLVVILVGSILGVLYIFNGHATAQTSLQLGQDALRKRDYQTAEKHFEAAALESPKSPVPLYWQSMLAVEQTNLPVAEHIAKKAAALDAKYKPALRLLVLLQLLDGAEKSMLDEKLAALKAADSGDPWAKCLEANGFLTRQNASTKSEVMSACPWQA